MKGKQLVLFDIALGSETAREELVNDTFIRLKYDIGMKDPGLAQLRGIPTTAGHLVFYDSLTLGYKVQSLGCGSAYSGYSCRPLDTT